MGAQLAVAGMVDADERVDPGRFGGGQLPRMKRPLVRGHRGQRVAHVADTGLGEIDHLESRDGAEDLQHTLGHAGHSWMLVQGHPLRHRDG